MRPSESGYTRTASAVTGAAILEAARATTVSGHLRRLSPRNLARAVDAPRSREVQRPRAAARQAGEWRRRRHHREPAAVCPRPGDHREATPGAPARRHLL